MEDVQCDLREGEERRYSPAKIIGVKTVGCGKPDAEISACGMTVSDAVHERPQQGLGHEAMMAIYFAWYNLVRVHSTLKTTPAVANEVTDHEWTLEELLSETAG